jgi:hypothetical protein
MRLWREQRVSYGPVKGLTRVIRRDGAQPPLVRARFAAKLNVEVI